VPPIPTRISIKAHRDPDPEPRSCPSEPTVHTLNDALFAQFAGIRSVAVKTCDYGSGGRGFGSLPARNTDPASWHIGDGS
jgi:hypothetical protein